MNPVLFNVCPRIALAQPVECISVHLSLLPAVCLAILAVIATAYLLDRLWR